MANVGGLEESSGDAYDWVSDAVLSISSMFVDVEGVKRLGAPSLWVKKGKDVKVEFLSCSTFERVCHKGKNADWFYMYTCVLVEIETKVPDCSTAGLKSFIKQRDEKEVSTSRVIKTEQGSEVNKPTERKKKINMKRMSSEEASGKKVIDLTEGR
ncbi:hypothetical protein PIB30_039213 [Stylosanthes scabra]|uniref:Uncharacterized protein n=1 Tax=Stylosanthes scabra TaxID=79078 RepID=A0ABU6REH3_9FABA|nr:hypothetical protein [Stylosanthes scabra]